MIFFLVSLLVYLGALLTIKPAPSSLKARPLSYLENFYLIRASLFSGVFILAVYLAISDFGFVSVNEYLYALLALNNDLQSAKLWPLQSITHLFIHGNLFHLFSNLAGLGIASVYERRVGSRRFLAVLVVGAIASIPSIFFYSETITVCGLSGGIFALAAAYFTDQDNLTIKEWSAAILFFLFFASILTLQSEFARHSDGTTAVKVDYLGHFLGACGAILYCRIRGLKPRSICG